MSRKSVKQECYERVSKKECQARVSCQDCPVKSVQQKCQARVPSKSVQQECQERVSCKSVLPRVSSKRVLSRVPCKTLLFLDDCASHLHKEKTSIFISALVSVHSLLHTVIAFGFVGSIRFFSCLQVAFFPECVAKGSRLTWESEGRAVFAGRCFCVRNRLQPSATIRKCSNPAPMALPLGRALKRDFSWTCHVSVCAAIPL